MKSKFRMTVQRLAFSAIASTMVLGPASLLADASHVGDALQVGCENDHRSLLGNVDQLTFEVESSTSSGRHTARYQLAGESFTMSLSQTENMVDANIDLEYTDGFRKISTRVRIAEIEGADSLALETFLSESEGDLLRSVRDSALRQMIRRGGDPVIQTFLQLQIALVNTRSSTGDSHLQPFNILDCGPYAACYWGCVIGGGGFYDCGTNCNGGGPGGLCY